MRLSFRFKTILGIAVIEAVVLSVLIWTGLNYMHASAEQEFIERARTTATLFATTTKDALIAEDLATLQALVAEVLRNRDVLYARVRNRHGFALAMDGGTEALASAFSPNQRVDGPGGSIFHATAGIYVGNSNFGQVEIGFSTKTLDQAFAALTRIFIAIAAVGMAVAALFSFAFGTYLTRQLDALRHGAQRLSDGDLGHQVAVRGHDELAATAEAFNAMSQRLGEALWRLRENEERLNAAERVARLGHWEWDISNHSRHWSDGAYRLFGLIPGDVAPGDEVFLGYVHADDRATVEATREAIAKDGLPHPFDYRIVRADGQLRTLHEHSAVTRDAQGRPIRVLGTVSDVTEQREAERLIQQTTSRLGALLANAPAGVIMEDEERRVVLANRALCELLALPDGPGTLVGMGLAELMEQGGVRFSDRAAVIMRMEQVAAALAPVQGEEFPLEDGGAVECDYTPVFANRKCTGHLWVLRDISEHKRLENKLAHLAYHDALTGLPNRRLFRELLRQALAHVARSGRGLAVLLVDVDKFKEINDRFGHAVGDVVLKVTSERMVKCLRDSDIVARLGGDEFAVVCEDIGKTEDLALVAEKLRQAYVDPVTIDGHALAVSASIGGALYPGDATDEETLLRCADIAMYRAKEAGRNAYRFFASA